jgi:hypothetical protein
MQWLEVIEQHAYEQSRFLRGAAIEEEKIPAIDAVGAAADAALVRYIHLRRRALNLLEGDLALWALFKSRFAAFTWRERCGLRNRGDPRGLAAPSAERHAARAQPASTNTLKRCAARSTRGDRKKHSLERTG